MAKIISSGFVVQCMDGKFLLGRTSKKNDQYCWTIFKGGTMENESLIETAIRELKEESGIDIAKDDRLNKNISTNYIHNYSIKDKNIYVFMLVDREGALDDFQFFCNSYYGTNNDPEIVEYRKFDLSEMHNYIFPSQRGLLDVLKRIEASKVSNNEPILYYANPNAIVTIETKE